jgi:hypothetical protein
MTEIDDLFQENKEKVEDELPPFGLVHIRRGLKPIQPVLDLLADYPAFICGGYARYCASPNTGTRLVKAGDVDIYSYDEATFEALYAHFKEVGLEIRHENDMAITWLKPKDRNNPYYGCPVLQLIKPVDEGAIKAVGDVEHVLENFDFSVIRCGIVWQDDSYWVLADADFLRDEEKKFLRIKNIHCPISSLLRFMKYARKGYHTKPGQVAKLFADWESRSDAYKMRLLELFDKSELREMTPEQIDELEVLMRID